MLGKNDSIGLASKDSTQNTRINSTRADRFHGYKKVTEKEPTETKKKTNDLLRVGMGWRGYCKQNFLNVA